MGYYSEVMQRNLNHSYELIKLLLSDLADDDLLIRPVPQGNHTAWELGHLIAREYRIGSQYFGVEFPELPTGFQEQHSEATARAESAVGFLSKAQYVDLINEIQGAMMIALSNLSDDDLDAPVHSKIGIWTAESLGQLLVLDSSERGMQIGQLTILRRKLGKAVLF
jgi:hypothetical protein